MLTLSRSSSLESSPGNSSWPSRRKGLFYPPDPASLQHCSIGGNIATNAGGPRCLKYGVTRNYVLGLEVVLANGAIVRCGGRTHKNKTGFDLVGLFVGSEGLLGVVSEATLRLLPFPPARAVLSAGFRDMRAASKGDSHKISLPDFSRLPWRSRIVSPRSRSGISPWKFIPARRCTLAH